MAKKDGSAPKRHSEKKPKVTPKQDRLGKIVVETEAGIRKPTTYTGQLIEAGYSPDTARAMARSALTSIGTQTAIAEHRSKILDDAGVDIALGQAERAATARLLDIVKDEGRKDDAALHAGILQTVGKHQLARQRLEKSGGEAESGDLLALLAEQTGKYRWLVEWSLARPDEAREWLSRDGHETLELDDDDRESAGISTDFTPSPPDTV